jgi:lambda repressor-like predicted transcriptional regulator
MGTQQPKPEFDAAKVVGDMVAKGWETKDLAQAAKKSPMTIRRFLKSEIQTTKTATAIASALGQPVERYLLDVITEAA